MPVLNEAALIEDALTALQPLRECGHELIVVDGGSSDGSVARARSLADRVLVVERGRAAQMNAGAAIASGEVLLFLHIDTRLPAEADRLIKQALARPGRHWGRFDLRLSGRAWLLRVVERAINWRSRLSGMVTGDQALFLRRELFETLGGFAPIPLMEDLELSRRLKRSGRPCCLRTPVLSSSRRWEENGILATIFLMWRLRAAWFFGADPRKLVKLYYQGSGLNE